MSEDMNKLTDAATPGPTAPDMDPEPVVTPSAESAAEEAPGPEAAVEADAVAEEPTAAEEAVAEEAVEDSAAEEEAVAEEPVAEEADVVEEPVAEEEPADDGPPKMDWYILKVQSNRERSISDALRRKVKIEGLEDYFGDIVVPTEKVTEFKGGKKKIVQRKLYPGYIVVHMHINDDTWFAVRETSGIGDFTGAGGKPTPMLPHEVARIIHTEDEETDEAPKLDIKFKLGDGVKVKEGTFEGFEGEVHAIDEHSGKVTVMINIFGRSTPVELEHWQIESV
ncbi:MAG: transcription termination/antitermination protein NusG [Planctomycetota bacterium]